MKTIVTKYVCVLALIVSLLIPSTAGAYTQADIDAMFGTVQSLLAQIAQLIADRSSVAEVSTGACSISVFASGKSSIASGSSTAVYWEASSTCTTGKLKGGIFGSEGLSVSRVGEKNTGSLTKSTTYTLSFGTVSKSVTVTVASTGDQAPKDSSPVLPTISLSASPASISAGQSATLTWSSANATSCTASNGWTGTKTTSGTQSVSPAVATTYSLTCTGTGGSATKSVVVPVTITTTPVPTITFSASPASISAGQSATLTWSSSDAISCTASGGWSGTKTTSGSESVSPTSNTNYALTCTGTGGSANQSAAVSVTTAPAPTVTLSASPASITAGQSSTLTWSSTNATSCTASNGWTGTKTTSGTQSVYPTTNTNYTLACSGLGGSATQSVNVGVVTVTPPPPAGGAILTPSALLPAYGPLVAKKATSIIPELATFDSRFLQYEKKHYDNYVLNTSGTPAVGYNHYGFLGSRLNYAIRNGLPYGAGVTNEATDMYARGRRVTLDWLSTYAVPNNYAVAQWQNTALEDLEALVVLENNPIARTQIHIDAARGTDDKPYMKMQASSADPRGITIFLQPMLIAHRLGIPYVHPGNGYSGTFDKTLGSWSNAAKRNIYWLDQYNVIQSDGTIISNAHKGAEAYFMSAMLVNQLIGYYGYIERDPVVFSMIQRSVDHWINVLPAGWDALPYQSIDTSTGSNNAPAEDLAGFFVYPSLVMWQETGNQKYYDFAIKNIRAANKSWVAGYKQFNQVYNTDVFSAEALISGVHWKPATPPYPPTGTVTPPPVNTPTVTLSASPASISAGQSATLTWSSANATSCTASNGWTGTKTTSGTQSVSPAVATTYSLTCTGTGGSATKSVTVSIGTVTLPPTQKFAVGDTVQTTANLNVRGTAGGALLGQQPLGALGKVLAGPVAAGDGVWWNIDYVNAPDGWSFEGYLVKSTVTPPTPAPTVNLSASPASISAGQSATLTWSSSDAISCTASGGWSGTKTTSGSESVSPTSNTNYTLTCTGSGGSASQSVSVSVSSSNNKFIIGDSVQTTANLNVRGTPAGTILGQQPLGALGKVIGGPMTVQSANELSTWWNIDYANAPDGWSFEPYLIKSTVSPPPGTPTVTLSANPTSVTAGSTSTLAWSSTNATSCTASNGWTGTKTTSGTQSVSPTATTTYTLTCTGSGGSATQSVIVNVGTVTNPLPIVTLSASPASISAGQSATLTWSSANATSCTASNGWTGTKTTSGTQSVSPTANTTYTITCAGNGGSVTKNVAVNMSAVTGPVTLPIQPLIFQVPMPTQTGKVWTIPAGDSTAFQSALNQAQLGDTIELVAGSTYTGNFTFPKKATGSGWIVVRTNKHTSLPPSGVRVGPSDAVNMAKIVSTNTGNTLSFPSGSHHYRLIGLEVTNAISNTSYIQTAIVSIDPGSSLNSVDLPNNITLDRVYVHSQPTTGVQRCVRVDGAYVAVVDSYLGECHAKGFDSQAIAGWNTNGPIKIVNNMLEGAGENVMFGGADPTVQGAIPSDIEIRNNHIYTPTTWKGTGGTTLWTKKNLFEIKAGKRILVEGNVFDGSWSDGQVGHAILLRSTNQGGKCVWCHTTDFTARYNIVRNVGGTGNISGNAGSSNANKIGGLTSRVLFEHNLFQNINVAPYTGVGRLIELYNNAQDVTYRNNTWDPMGGAIQHYITGGASPTATNFTYVDNIAPFGQYGVVPGYTEAALKAVVTGIYNYSGNVVYTNQPSNAYSTTKYPTTPLYSNYSTALSAGKGANIPAVLAATKNAVSGNGMGTTPPPLSVSNGPVFAITNTPVVLGESAVGLVFNRTLVKGMKGNDVTALQEVLSKLGFFTESISGYFGSVTEKAVQDLQLQYGIAASGTPETTGFGAVGPKTQQKLVELQK